MEEWGNWKYRTHIPRWFPSYPRLSWLLRLFLHLHSLPFPPFHIHLLYCYSMLGLLSFIFPPLIPLLPDPLSVLSSQYLFSPLLSVFLTPPPPNLHSIMELLTLGSDFIPPLAIYAQEPARCALGAPAVQQHIMDPAINSRRASCKSFSLHRDIIRSI